MATRTPSTPKDDRLTLRASADDRHLVASAAAACGMSVSEFIRTHVLTAARQVLADRREFVLDEKAWRDFCDALQQPGPPRPKLQALIGVAGPLDEPS